MSLITEVVKQKNGVISELRSVIADLEAQLEACEAANAYLLAQSRVKSAPGYQAGGWRQWETRRL